MDKVLVGQYGYQVRTSEKWSNKDFIVESYNEFMRMCTLSQNSKVSGRKIVSMSFDRYLNECKENLKLRKQEVVKQLLCCVITKQEAEFAEWLISKCEEGIKWYFGLTEKEKSYAIYPVEAPTEREMKERVESQAETTEIQNVPTINAKGEKTVELKVVEKGSTEGKKLEKGDVLKPFLSKKIGRA